MKQSFVFFFSVLMQFISCFPAFAEYKWPTYQDKNYPFSFFSAWDGGVQTKMFMPRKETDPPHIKYVAGGAWPENRIGDGDYWDIELKKHMETVRGLWQVGGRFEGFVVIVFDSHTALREAMQKEIADAKKEKACQANGYRVQKSTVTIKGGIKAIQYTLCFPYLEYGGMEDDPANDNRLEAAIWRVPQGLPEAIAFVTHYRLPVKKRVKIKHQGFYEGEDPEDPSNYVDVSSAELNKEFSQNRKDALRVLNSFEWHTK